MSESTRVLIAEFVSALKRGVRGRVSWVAPENLHLTLHFFGEISERDADSLAAALEAAAADLQPFIMGYGEFGAFPSLNRPNVIWLGLRRGAVETEALKARLDDAIHGANGAFDDKRFHPHITLGRARDPHLYLPDLKANVQTEDAVNEVILMQSKLTPQGSHYTPLKRIGLGVAAHG
ncbi:MAG: RNA 2',3'-cyclic phosphodiesterase [bacterium]